MKLTDDFVIPPKAWREMGRLNRVCTVILVLVWPALIVSFLVSAWVETTALSEPRVAMGLHQYPFVAKGCSYFLTREQYKIVRFSERIRDFSFVVLFATALILKRDQILLGFAKAGGSRRELAVVFRNWNEQLRLFGFRRRLDLVSPMSVADCLDKVGYRLMLETGSVRGKIKGNKLKAQKRISYRNSFQRVLTARFVEGDRGTLIRCSFAMTPFISVFLVFWFGFSFIFGLIGLMALAITVIYLRRVSFGEILVPSVGFLLVGFGWLLLKFGFALSMGDEDFLISILRYETKAEMEGETIVGR